MKILTIYIIIFTFLTYFLYKSFFVKYSISIPSTPVPSTPVPSTPVPSTPVPSTPLPSTPVPSTPVPSTPVPSTPVPFTPVPSTIPIVTNSPQNSLCKLSFFSDFSSCNPITAKETACSTVLEKGLTCPSPLNEVGAQYCVTRECDVNCEFSDWIKEGSCDYNTRKQKYKRIKLVNEKRNGTCFELDYYGNKIYPPTYKEEDCDPNCIIGDWTNWSGCIPNYDNNTASRYRTRTNSCNNQLEYQYENCPVDCLLSDWIIETGCNKQTGTKNNKHRKILKPSINNGNCSLEGGVGAIQYIQGENCPVNCEWGDWQYQNTSGSGCNCTDNFIKRKTIVEKNGGICDIMGESATQTKSEWTPINKTFNYQINGNTLNTGVGCCNRYFKGTNRFGDPACISF